jgi:hypothetical protein
MEFAIGLLIGASLGCSFGYLLSAIIGAAKQADIFGRIFDATRSVNASLNCRWQRGESIGLA